MRSIRVLLCIICLSMTLIAMAGEHTWSRPDEIPGFKSNHGIVSAAFHDGVLHVVTSDRDKNIKHVRCIDGQWIAPVSLAFLHSGLVPDIGVSDGTLHMIHLPGHFKLWHSAWDGNTWQEMGQIPAMKTRTRVQLTGMDGVLHLTHGGENLDRKRVFHAANAGWGWGHNYALPDQSGRSPAALVGLDGTLHMVYVSKNSDTVWHTSCTQWGEWTPPAQIPGVETRRSVDMAAANGRLFMAFVVGTKKYGEQAPVAYCEWSDGQWSTPTTLKDIVCYGAPALAVEPVLPQQVHVLLPSKVGVLHLQTEDKVQLAPLQPKTMQVKR